MSEEPTNAEFWQVQGIAKRPLWLQRNEGRRSMGAWQLKLYNHINNTQLCLWVKTALGMDYIWIIILFLLFVLFLKCLSSSFHILAY